MADDANLIESYLRGQLEKMLTAEEMPRVVRDLPKLVASVEKTDLCVCLPMVAGLMTIPELQPNLIRLEALVHVVVARAAGTEQSTLKLIDRWLNVDLAADLLMRAEDPVEDVFVTNVVTGGGNRRIFTGVWETPDFWLQSVIDVLSVGPRSGPLSRIRDEMDALLRVSNREQAWEPSTRARIYRAISPGIPSVLRRTWGLPTRRGQVDRS